MGDLTRADLERIRRICRTNYSWSKLIEAHQVELLLDLVEELAAQVVRGYHATGEDTEITFEEAECARALLTKRRT